MGSANAALVTIARERTYGNLASGTPKMCEVRTSDMSLTPQTSFTTSREIRSDGQIADRVMTDLMAGGNINGELSYGGNLVTVTSGQISANSGTSKFSAPNTTFANIAVGDWIQFHRPGSANNGYWYVTAKGGSDQDLTVVGEGTATLATETAGSEAEIAVLSEFDARLQGLLRSSGWTKPIDVSAANYFSIDGSGKIARTAISVSWTSRLSVDGSGRLADSSSGFVSAGFKAGMQIVIGGFSTAGNNGRKTIATVAAGLITFVNETLTTESSPVGAVTIAADFVNDGFAVGDWIKTTGWATSANNTYVRVTAVAAGTLTVLPALTTESAPAGTVYVRGGSFIKNGTHDSSFQVETQQTDETTLFDVASGQFPNDATFQIGTKSINGVQMSFVGKTVDPDNVATVGTGSNRAATTSDVMNAISHVIAVRENDTALGTYARSVSLRIASNRFARDAIANLGPIGYARDQAHVGHGDEPHRRVPGRQRRGVRDPLREGEDHRRRPPGPGHQPGPLPERALRGAARPDPRRDGAHHALAELIHGDNSRRATW